MKVKHLLFCSSILVAPLSYAHVHEQEQLQPQTIRTITIESQNKKSETETKVNEPKHKITLKFQDIDFNEKLLSAKKASFYANRCLLFDKTPKTYKDIEALHKLYYLLSKYNDETFEFPLNNKLSSFNYFYLKNDDAFHKDYINTINSNKDLFNEEKCNTEHNLRDEVEKFIYSENLELEKVDSLLTNREFSIKGNNSNFFTKDYVVEKMKSSPYNLSNLIISFISTRNCAWDVKNAKIIDGLLNKASNTISIFSNNIFNDPFERKVFNYLTSYNSVLYNKDNVIPDSKNEDFCLVEKKRLEDLVFNYSK